MKPTRLEVAVYASLVVVACVAMFVTPTKPILYDLTERPKVRSPLIHHEDAQAIWNVMASERGSIAISIRGIRVPAEWDFATEARIFVNNPKADASTSTDDDSYVQSLLLSPFDPEKPQNVLVDLTESLRKQSRAGKWSASRPGIRLTMFLVPPSGRKLDTGAKLEYEGAFLRVIEE